MADDPAQLWQERAERYRRSAAYYRTLIEQGEQQGEQPGPMAIRIGLRQRLC